MKKIWIISLATCFTAVTANAQETDLSLRAYSKEMNQNELSGPSGDLIKHSDLTDPELKQFSYQTRANFYADFGYIPITGWEISGEFDKISFIKNGVLYTAYYDYDSELVGTTSNVSITDLPAHALENINKKYEGYTIGDVVFFDDNELNESEMVYYGNPFDDADNYFVELKNDKEKIVVKVNTAGDISFFTTLK
jgi:hypothetical protein